MFVFPDLVSGLGSANPVSTARGLSATQREACMCSLTTQEAETATQGDIGMCAPICPVLVKLAMVYDSWMAAPNSLYSEVLNALHSAHQGITSLKAHTQTCMYWPSMSISVVKCYQQCSLCDAIIIILPASITCLPTTNTNTCSGWLHPLGRSALSGVIWRQNYTAGVCVSEAPMDKSDTWLLLRVYRNGLAHLGSTRKYQIMETTSSFKPPAVPPSRQLEECTRDYPLHITQSNCQFLHPNKLSIIILWGIPMRKKILAAS